MWNVPNVLTMLRIVLIPVFVVIFYLPSNIVSPPYVNMLATLFFVLAAVTDWFDGYLARVLNQTSQFGAFLDPVADKLMVAAALIVLVELERVGAAIALIIIGREIAISALREWMAGLGQGGSVAVAFVGKLKTALQMIAIPFLLYHDPISILNTQWLGEVLIWIAAFLTLVSMAYYVRSAWPTIVDKK